MGLYHTAVGMSDANHPPRRSSTDIAPANRKREALFGEDPGAEVRKYSLPEAEDDAQQKIVIFEDGDEVGYLRSDGDWEYHGAVESISRFMERVEDGRVRMSIPDEDGHMQPHIARGEELLSRLEERLIDRFIPHEHESF